MIFVVVLGAALLTGCKGEPAPDLVQQEPPIRFDSTRVAIHTAADTIILRVEVARSEEEQRHGLMERTSLPPDAGMLFVYDAPRDSLSGFWMFRTRIPLDIAFIDSTGAIVSIQSMQPCASPDPRWCKGYVAGVSYQSALEVNRGFFLERGIGVGSKVEIIGRTQ